jgi:hypothetical protein
MQPTVKLPAVVSATKVLSVRLRSVLLRRRIGKSLRFSLCSLACSLALLSLAGGCSWHDTSGTRHVVVIGFGVVSVQDSKPRAATVTKANVLGIKADSTGVSAGYSSSFVTAVPDKAEDVRIESSTRPLKPITIEIQKAVLSHETEASTSDEL